VRVPGQFPLSILVGLAALTWLAVAVALYGASPDPAFFKPMSFVVGVVGTTLAAWDRFVWRIPKLSAVHGIPDLNGTWVGELKSNWKDPTTGVSPGPIPIVIVIKQTYTAMTVATHTAESSSNSVAAGMHTEPDGRHAIVSLYRNEPRLSVQDRSRIHYGGVRLNLVGSEDHLQGPYWSDRGTSGEIAVRFVSRTRVLDFTAGQALAGSKS
jgi:hypothetical protein